MQGEFYTPNPGKNARPKYKGKIQPTGLLTEGFSLGVCSRFFGIFFCSVSAQFLSTVQLLSPQILLAGEGSTCARGSGAQLLLAMP